MEKRCKYDMIDRMLRDNRTMPEIMGAAHCSYSSALKRKKTLGLTRGYIKTSRTPPDYGAAVSMPSLSVLAERAARATAKRLGMDFERFKKEWLPGKIYDPEAGFVDKPVVSWPNRIGAE
jgi:hypothetical protein